MSRSFLMLGYGTQFAPELDEEDRIVDSPVQHKKPQKKENTPPEDIMFKCEACGKVIKPYIGTNGVEVSIRKHVATSKAKFGKQMCVDCCVKESNK